MTDRCQCLQCRCSLNPKRAVEPAAKPRLQRFHTPGSVLEHQGRAAPWDCADQPRHGALRAEIILSRPSPVSPPETPQVYADHNAGNRDAYTTPQQRSIHQICTELCNFPWTFASCAQVRFRNKGRDDEIGHAIRALESFLGCRLLSEEVDPASLATGKPVPE